MTAVANFAWLKDTRLQSVFSALHKEGEARLVGGCVRDSFLGLSPFEHDGIDIDIATTLAPDDMKQAFDRASIRWVSTGEAHGTLTAILDGLICECTALRSDVETDGRHAQVAFTKDWDLDWRRRDFTINAIYADHQGEVWDPAGGLTDLEAHRVRFIGEAAARIREDALRILRFFRFSARFGVDFDRPALEAIAVGTSLIEKLSKERVWSEVSRTLDAKNAPEALAEATKLGVLRRIMPAEPELDVFASLHRPNDTSPALGLAALWPGQSREALQQAFKPSNEILTAYQDIENAFELIRQGTTTLHLLYLYGRERSIEAARLAAAREVEFGSITRDALATKPIPVLPLSGKDIIAQGVPPGEQVGRTLKRFETAWLDAGTPQDAQLIDELLRDALSGKAPG